MHHKRNLYNIVKFMMPIIGGSIISFFVIRLRNRNQLQGYLLTVSLFREMEWFDFDRWKYFIYLLKLRGLLLGGFLFMRCINKLQSALLLFGWLYGIGLGLGAEEMYAQWSWKGIVGYIIMLLPHQLCYLYAYYMALNSDQNGQSGAGYSVQKSVKKYRMSLVFGVVIIGMVLECYVNPFFLKFLSKIFF